MLRGVIRPAMLAFCCAVMSVAQAGPKEDAVRQAFEKFAGMPVVSSVTQMQYGGLYEVALKNGQLVYTDETVSFLMDGRIIDTKTRSDVTQQRMMELSSIDFSTLPLDNAIKQVRGSGERVIVSFEDPNCSYCKKLWQEFKDVDNVTLYTFLYPILSEESNQLSHNIWCAKNRSQVWNDWVMDNKLPPTADCKTDVVDKNVELGRNLKIFGTPTLFLADGSRLGGYMSAAQLEQTLAAKQLQGGAAK